jgi:dipeptidyl aminopeptidase/acylaminoacyl peptidase
VATEEGKICSDGAATVAWKSRPAAEAAAPAASSKPTYAYPGGDLEKDSALLEEFSPMRDVNKIVSPLFVYAGQNNPRVPRSESDLIVKTLRARRMPVEYMVATSEGHGLDLRATKIEFLTRAACFLEDNAKP